MEQRFSESSMEQRSNRHLFKLQLWLPCWPILTFFSKFEQVVFSETPIKILQFGEDRKSI
jgi:hypothetical protein